MKKLQVFTAAAGILLALAAPTFAAQRVYRGVDAYASSVDRSGPYNYGPAYGRGAYGYVPNEPRPAHTYLGTTPSEHIYGGSPYPKLPYADRPYGAPDSW